jgi:hypothetical protein
MLTVNHCSCRYRGRNLASALLICSALAGLALPIRAHAQFTGKASATGQFESNSNVFDLSSGLEPPGNNGRRSDTYFAYGADFDVNYSWGRQVFFATASTKEYNYQHFSDLNHNDYNVDTGLAWKLGGIWDGKLEVTRTHTMVPFSDLSGSALELSVLTEQRETAQIGVKLFSDWKIEASGYTSKDEEPIALAPNLQLTQNSGTASLEYFGFGGLTSGLTATYLSGDYRNTNGTENPSFDQTTVGLLAKYKLSRTTFDGQLGYSRRNSATGTDNTSGLTGLFDWKQQLTPKTSFTVKVDRMINSYFLNSGSEIDTEAGAIIDWQATYKLGVSVGYTFTYRFFPGQGNNPVGSDRTDIQELATMTINYQPQRWLQIKPYANVTTRRSTFIGGHFSQNIFGVSVIVTPYRPRSQGR